MRNNTFLFPFGIRAYVRLRAHFISSYVDISEIVRSYPLAGISKLILQRVLYC